MIENHTEMAGGHPTDRRRLRRIYPEDIPEVIRMYMDPDIPVVAIQERFHCDARRIYEVLPDWLPRRGPRRR